MDFEVGHSNLTCGAVWGVGLASVYLRPFSHFLIFSLFLILIWHGCSHFFLFCIFIKLMMYYIMIECRKMISLH
jgi:hypothetical protein